MKFTPDELDLLHSRMEHDIQRLKNLPMHGKAFNNFVSTAIQRREKIITKINNKRLNSYANS